MDETVLSKQQIAELGDQLVSRIAQLPSCIVAFSGGVDSAVVAKAAHLALGDKAVAITGVSASLASGELKEAQAIAQDIGIRHQTVTTEEINSEGYQQNGPDRCWHCKNELYRQLSIWAGRTGVGQTGVGHSEDGNQRIVTILSGTNADLYAMRSRPSARHCGRSWRLRDAARRGAGRRQQSREADRGKAGADTLKVGLTL